MMAGDRAILLGWLSALASELVTDGEDGRDVSRRISAATALSAADFAGEALALMRVIGESTSTPAGFDRLTLPAVEAGATLDAAVVLLVPGLCVSGAKVDWPSRPMARAARTRIAVTGEAALSVATAMGGDGADLYAWVSAILFASVRVVSELAANAVPVVRVSTGISLPSTVLAYQLYGDASRAGVLVDIAGSATPMLMPSGFDALGS